MIACDNYGSLLLSAVIPIGIALPRALAIGVTISLLLVAALLARLLHRLQHRQTRLQELFEQLPHAAALTSSDDRVVRINRHFTRLFGYAPQAASGRLLTELIVPAAAQQEYLRHRALVARGQRVEAEGSCLRQDGSAFAAAFTFAPFSLPGEQTAVYAIYRDITELGDMVDERWAREGRWRAVFDNSAVGISVTDTHGRFIVTNRAYQEMVGYSQEELRNLTYMDLTDEQDRPLNAALAAENWAGKLPQYQLEKRYRRRDGRSIWVRISVSNSPGAGSSPPLGICIVEDITERKRAEDALVQYQRVVEDLQEMILVIDRDYRYLIANPAYLKYRNLERDQIVGHAVRDLLGPELFDGIIQSKMDECFQGKIVKYEIPVVYPTLGERDVFVSYFPIEGPTGIDRIGIVLEDVTERNRSARQLQRSLLELHALNAQLQSVREEERTRLARELHDELGQSLTAIKIDVAALKNAPVPEPQRQRIDAILRLVDHTIHSVRRISTELRPGILDDLGLVAAVEWAAEEFQARTRIECRVAMPEPNPTVDPALATALFRIFQETLTNVARHARATQVTIGLRQESAHLSLEVSDNGHGIHEEQSSAPTSLGILGMRERALLLGGDFSIGVAPSGGTLVRVRLPSLPSPRPEAGL